MNEVIVFFDMEGTKIRKKFIYYSELLKKPFAKAECN